MDKMGIGALIAGIVLILVGAYAIWAFLPDVITFVKGGIGIVVLVVGLLLAIFGAMMVKD